MLAGKKVIIGISGGIAAYKAAILIRLFKKADAEVKVVVTAHALEFITRVTLESLSANKVYDSLFGDSNDYTTEHVALTDWGDVFVVAPATANIIGKMAGGIADDALSTSLIAFDKQVFLAPAMNCKMYEHYAVQKNLAYLKEQGVQVIAPADGFLACGYEGKGRMEEPEHIFKAVQNYFQATPQNLKGKKILVTAGPTREQIDPVRYLGNHSSGKMGFALAEELAGRGAEVQLVAGPVKLSAKHTGINRTDVVSAQEMLEACMQYFNDADAVVMAAAVADFRPEKQYADKIKKQDTESPQPMTLVPTTDILAAMGAVKKHQVLVGFALETSREEDNAIKKLKKKNLDFIVLNSLRDAGSGFGVDTNKITIINNKKEVFRYPLKGKTEVASDIADMLEKTLTG